MKKRYWIPLLILVIIIAFRLALPHLVTNYVNRTLQEIDGYSGSIAGVDIRLIRGAYAVDSLTVYMEDSLRVDTEEDEDFMPFATIDRIEMNMDWGSLLRGAIVGNIALISPGIHFVAAPVEQTGEEVDWAAALQELMPIRINKFSVIDGTVNYYDFDSDPEVHVPLNDLQVEIFNITNVERSDEDLPTRIEISAVSLGDGNLNITADASLIETIPEMDLLLEFEEMNLPDLNEFMEAYAGVDVERGNFSLYSEFTIEEGMLEGYIQPMIFDLRVLDLEDEDHDVFSAVWEMMVEGVTQVFRNQPQNQFATRVPISGQLDDAEVGVFPGIWNIIRNAFIEALEESATGVIFSDDDEQENENEEQENDE